MPRKVDRFDWEIVAFMVTWAPYGGPEEEDIMPTFGMTCQEFRIRFGEIVNTLMTNDSIRLTRRQYEMLRRAVQLVPQQQS